MAPAQPLAKYSAWRRAGDLVFLSGVIGGCRLSMIFTSWFATYWFRSIT